MPVQEEIVHTIHTNTTGGGMSAIAAKLDAENRSAAAFNAYPEFFTNPVHMKKVQEVCSILDGFFKTRKATYIVYRENRGKPFTSVKIEKPVFPAMSPAKKQELF